MHCAGIVVCGGHSTRLGRDKAALPFGTETLLARVARIVGQATDPVIVVAQSDQPLPPLPGGVRIAHDRRPGRGPLEGLAVGLALAQGAGRSHALLCAGDMPLLSPEVLARLVALAADHPLTAIREQEHPHPLCAVYGVELLPEVERLLSSGSAGPSSLLRRPDALCIEPEQLGDRQRVLESLGNVNTPEEYRAALAAAGLTSGEDVWQS